MTCCYVVGTYFRVFPHVFYLVDGPYRQLVAIGVQQRKQTACAELIVAVHTYGIAFFQSLPASTEELRCKWLSFLFFAFPF